MVAYKERKKKKHKKTNINLMNISKEKICGFVFFLYLVLLPPLILYLVYAVEYPFLSFPVYHFYTERKT